METLFDVRQRRLLQLMQTRFDNNQTRLAEAIGRTSAYVSFLLTDKNLPHHKNLGEKLAHHIEDCVGLPRGWLDGVDRDMKLGRVVAFPNQESLPTEFTMIPRRKIKLAAGNGAILFEEEDAPALAFRKDWLMKEGLKADKLVVAYAQGDSMTPRIHDGDMIMIDISTTNLSEGKVYAIRAGDELRIKKVYKRIDSVVLQSDNPAYPSEEIPMSRAAELHIIGRVVWVSSTL